MATCCGLVLTVNDLEFGEHSCVQNLFLSDRAGRSKSVISTWSILSQKYTFCLGMQQGVVASAWSGCSGPSEFSSYIWYRILAGPALMS